MLPAFRGHWIRYTAEEQGANTNPFDGGPRPVRLPSALGFGRERQRPS